MGSKWGVELIWNNEFNIIKSQYMYVNTISNSYIELFIYLSDKSGSDGWSHLSNCNLNYVKSLVQCNSKNNFESKKQYMLTIHN